MNSKQISMRNFNGHVSSKLFALDEIFFAVFQDLQLRNEISLRFTWDEYRFENNKFEK